MDLDETGVFPVVFDMSKTTVVNLGGPGRSMNRDDPGGSRINRSTAGLSGTDALSQFETPNQSCLHKNQDVAQIAFYTKHQTHVFRNYWFSDFNSKRGKFGHFCQCQTGLCGAVVKPSVITLVGTEFGSQSRHGIISQNTDSKH